MRHPARRRSPIDMALVGTDYFDAMGIPVLSGRSFNDTDDQNAPAVVDDQPADGRSVLAAQNPVGQFVNIMGPHDSRVPRRDHRRREDRQIPKPRRRSEAVLLSIAAAGLSNPACSSSCARAGDRRLLTRSGRKSAALDPRMALVGVETLEQHMQLPLFPARAAGLLLGCSACSR